jgi:hypothetical protein
MKQGPFPHPGLCCPPGCKRYYGPPATLPAGRDFAQRAYTRPSLPGRTTADPGPARASPLPAPTFPTMPIPLPRGVLGRCTSRIYAASVAFALNSRARLPLVPDGLASRGGRIHLMLRPGRSLPPTGLSTLGFDAGRFPPTPPACYPAPWRLPGPDFHRHGRCELMFRSDHQMHHLRTVGTRINPLGRSRRGLEPCVAQSAREARTESRSGHAQAACPAPPPKTKGPPHPWGGPLFATYVSSPRREAWLPSW